MFLQKEDKKETTLKPWLESKKIDPSRLHTWAETIRGQGKTIATLNGSFDLMHAGHLHILFQASLQADLLLVALNSDESIRQYKSITRPIISLPYRLELLSAIGFVDHVTWFHETDPRAFLEIVRPDVHVNGVEYGPHCIEAEVVRKHGGRLHLVDRIPGLATSQIIERIKALCD